jgi:predicted nuclease with TOPRIM domain
MTESWKLSDATWLRQQYDRLKAENEMRIQDHLKTCKEFDQLTAERDALKAELEAQVAGNLELRDAYNLLHNRSAAYDETCAQLTELRKAAEELEKRARTEAEFLQSEGYKRGMYLEQDCDEFKAVLAKLTP